MEGLITPTPPQVDFIRMGSNGSLMGSGRVAARLIQSGFNVNSLRTLDVLRKEEWIQFDTTVVGVARKRLVAVGDLISRGLVFNVANALGTTRVEWEQVSDMEPAEVSMAGVTQGERDRVIFSLQNVPLPIIHKDFRLNIRALEASRKLGETLDTTMAALASKLVSEKIEDILFNGSITAGGGTIFGYTTATNRNTGSIPIDWELVGATGELILDDVLGMLAAAVNDNMFGPYGLYVPILYYNKLLDDFKTNSDRTTLERILAIPEIEFVRQTKDLSGGGSGEVLLVTLSPEVVDIIDGMQPTTVEWSEEGGMITKFKVMAIMIPRIKDDLAVQSGIIHFTV